MWAATLLVLLFGVGALGIVGDGGPPDLMYLAAAVVGLVGAAVARFRPAGTARALAATAGLTLVAGVVAVAAGWQEERLGRRRARAQRDVRRAVRRRGLAVPLRRARAA